MRVDLDGFMRRAVPLPMEPAEISALEVRNDAVFYATQPPDTLAGALPGETPMLHRLDLVTEKTQVVLEGADSHVLSADGRRIVYKAGEDWLAADASANHPAAVRLAPQGLPTRVDPRQEWREMFDNAWRLERDLFVNSDMNGDDWGAVHEAYARLLPQVATRDDLNYLIGELIGELTSSHTYVGGGDDGQPQSGRPLAYLGADFDLDAGSGRYRISKIYTGDNTRRDFYSPLAWPGLAVHEGDLLLAVDGHELRAPDTPDTFLAGATETVKLTVASTPDGPRRSVSVVPVHSETALRRLDWERQRRAMVDRLSNGRVGYLHMDDMQDTGMQSFTRGFYPELGKEGLIVDDRYNGGGNNDEMVLERLRRTLSGVQTLRDRTPQTQPDQVQAGPKAMLVNHFSASDGDVFPLHFRACGLGPLVGTRTWGGVRGIAWFWPLLDGGYVTVPQITFYGRDGTWSLENHGNDPDVEIEDAPSEILTGDDVQLRRTVELLMAKLPPRPAGPISPPAHGDYPVEGQAPPAHVKGVRATGGGPS